MRRMVAVLVLSAGLAVLATTPVTGQAVQAYEDVRTRVKVWVNVREAIQSRTEQLLELGEQESDGTSKLAFINLASRGTKLLLRSEADLQRSPDVPAFFEDYDALVTTKGLQTRGVPPAAQAQLVAPKVSFVVTFSGATTEADGVGDVAVSTNLLGAAVGTAFDGLGSDALKTFFTKNLSAGPAIPFAGEARISGQIGLGLGGVDFLGLTFWPVLGMAQADSADQRVPRRLVTRKNSVARWSQPAFAVAIVPPGMVKRLQDGKPALIFTVGVALPYYYDGDPFAAMANLFAIKSSSFEKEGKAQFQFGVSVPLFRVGDTGR